MPPLKGRFKDMAKGTVIKINRRAIPFNEKVKRVMKKNSELKHLTTTVPIAAVSPGVVYNAVLTAVPMPAAGAQPTDTTRIGDKITLTSLHIKAKATIDSDVGNAPEGYLIRCVVYQYKPNNALLAPNQTRLFVSDNTLNPGPMSHQNIDHHADYHILYDSTKTMSNLIAANAGSVPMNGIRFWNFYVPLKRATKSLQFDNATLGHNDAIYVAFFSDSTGVGDPIVDVQARLRFLDG